MFLPVQPKKEPNGFLHGKVFSVWLMMLWRRRNGLAMILSVDDRWRYIDGISP
jgi:hypothetical protein